MKHLTLLNPNIAAEGALIKRSTGRYFTPLWLATALASRIASFKSTNKKLRIVDPFCGDGRLIVAYLDVLDKLGALSSFDAVQVNLWDNCKTNIRMAREAVRNSKRRFGFSVEARTKVQDSFIEGKPEYGKYDVVITNPPWETIKPDSRETGQLSGKLVEAVRDGLRDYDRQLALSLPHSQPIKKLYGWGTNLSRCGLELSVNLLTNRGVCGIVLPSAVYGDQMSTKLREWLFTQVQIEYVDHFPAEAKLFEGVDQSVMTTVLKKVTMPTASKVTVSRHDRNHRVIGMDRLDLTHRRMKEHDFRIPTELSHEEFELQKRLAGFPSLSQWEVINGGSLWMGRELDETNYKSFVSPNGMVPFIKGRDVHRFGAVEARPPFLISDRRKVPASAAYQRLAWRDVSRRSQKRRMLATLIPKGFVTGNSLNVGYFADGDLVRLRALLGIFNSLVFEFQLRSRLATGHVSLGSVRSIHVPDLDDKALMVKLAQLVSRVMDNDLTAEISLELLIADSLELNAKERKAIVCHFDGISEPLRTVFQEKLGSRA